MGEARALVALDGGLASVDLETGLGAPIEGAKHASLDADCQSSEAAGSAWFSCSSGSGASASVQLLRVPLEAPSVIPIAMAGRRWAGLQSTSAGGLELTECSDPIVRPEGSHQQSGAVRTSTEPKLGTAPSARRGSCALQSDGSFVFIEASRPLGPTRTGALFDLWIDGPRGVLGTRTAPVYGRWWAPSRSRELSRSTRRRTARCGSFSGHQAPDCTPFDWGQTDPCRCLPWTAS